MNVKSNTCSYIGLLSVSLLTLAACNPSQTQVAETSGEGQDSEQVGQATVVVLEVQSDEADGENTATTAVEPTNTEAATNTPSAAELASSVILNVSWSGNVAVSVQGSSSNLQADGLPSHGWLELYAGKSREGDILQDGPRTQNLNYTIQLNPVYTGIPLSTGGSAIGLAISGATFFNPFEGFEDSVDSTTKCNFEGRKESRAAVRRRA